MKINKDDDNSFDSFANFVVQELQECEYNKTTRVSSTSPAISPMMLMMSSSHKDGVITNLMSLGNVDITALNIPVEECTPTVSGEVVIEKELVYMCISTSLDHKLSIILVQGTPHKTS